MLEVEKAALNTEAIARLDVLREQMGLPVASPGGHEGAELLAEAKKLEAPGASSSPETPAS
jgi:hypothetical protein